MSAARTAFAAVLASSVLLVPSAAFAQKGPPAPVAAVGKDAVAARPYGVVNDVWVEYDVSDAGYYGMVIHLDFDVDNGLDVPSRAVAYFSYAGGEPLLDFDGDYTADDGQVSAGTDFTPIYASTNFEDLTIFMPYDQLHMEPGTSELEFYIELYAHHDGSLIAEAGPFSFTFTQAAPAK